MFVSDFLSYPINTGFSFLDKILAGIGNLNTLQNYLELRPYGNIFNFYGLPVQLAKKWMQIISFSPYFLINLIRNLSEFSIQVHETILRINEIRV